MSAKPNRSTPWLLYSYPWMPYPRRVQIYLREKHIPETAIKVVHVTDPQRGNQVHHSHLESDSSIPPRPEGSLPILAIPNNESRDSWVYIRQSMAIITYLEFATGPDGPLSYLPTQSLHTGDNPLEAARLNELTTLAEELTILWNPVRTFGSGAGTMNRPDCAREMFRWVARILSSVNSYLADRDLEALKDEEIRVSVADIVLFQFLEFVDYCYSIDVTTGTGEVKTDVYGRSVEEKYENLESFYGGFRARKCARREEDLGEFASDDVLEKMRFWHEGVW